VDFKHFYLDYNSTSPLSQSVTDWLKSGGFHFANPASQHSYGKQSRKIINQVTDSISKVFSVDHNKQKIVYHSGATEAISSVTYSFSKWARDTKRKLLICYSLIDHPAVLSQAEKTYESDTIFYQLQRNLDFTYNDELNYAEILRLKNEYPDLIILYHHLWVHNELGHIAPLENLKKIKLISDLYIHVDAVQAPGKILDWTTLTEGDIFTFSAHKFGALKGVGFSIYTSSIPQFPLITGGGQQALRSGTQNIMGIQSIQLALNDLLNISISDNFIFKEKLQSILVDELDGIGALVSGRGPLMNSNTIYFYFNHLSSDISVALFDLHGIMISAGAACSSGASKPAQVLIHVGLDKFARNGLRISLPFHMTIEDLDEIIKRLKIIFKKIRETA
jgi:cysteine desulfurase